MAAEQVYRLAARGVHPQGTIVGHGSDDIGNHIVAHSDDVGVGIRDECLKVIGRFRAMDGIGQHTGMLQAAAVDLRHLATGSQAMSQARRHITRTDNYHSLHISCKISSSRTQKQNSTCFCENAVQF